MPHVCHRNKVNKTVTYVYNRPALTCMRLRWNVTCLPLCPCRRTRQRSPAYCFSKSGGRVAAPIVRSQVQPPSPYDALHSRCVSTEPHAKKSTLASPRRSRSNANSKMVSVSRARRAHVTVGRLRFRLQHFNWLQFRENSQGPARHTTWQRARRLAAAEDHLASFLFPTYPS